MLRQPGHKQPWELAYPWCVKTHAFPCDMTPVAKVNARLCCQRGPKTISILNLLRLAECTLVFLKCGLALLDPQYANTPTLPRLQLIINDHLWVIIG